MDIGTQQLPPSPSQPKHRYGGINSQLDKAFYGEFDPFFTHKRERPIHRVMADMHVAGSNVTEIAEATGYSRQAVCNILRQPFAHQRMIEKIENDVQQEIKNLLEKAAPAALERVIDISERASSEQVRLAANNAILDRFLGKPTQPISTSVSDPKNLTNEELGREVQKIVAGVATKTGNTA